MVRFSLSKIAASAWKNGGGLTREIALFPTGASLNDFEWRISVATVSQSGPFSRFPGMDRIIMLLEGDGLALTGKAIEHRLDRVGVPFAFEADEALDCALLGAPSSDLNVMSRRATLQASLDIFGSDSQAMRGCGGLVMSLDGAWQVKGEPIDPQEGFWWTDAGEPIELRCLSAGSARLVAVRLEPRL